MSILSNTVNSSYMLRSEQTHTISVELGHFSSLGASFPLNLPASIQRQAGEPLPIVFNNLNFSQDNLVSVDVDPMIEILANFNAIPQEYRSEMFADFRTVATEEDFRGLLDTISDWAATAELHARPSLAKEVEEAIGGRREVGDWLPG